MKDNEIMRYQVDENVQLDVRFEDETVWLSQVQIANLYGVDRTVIVKHIRNIYRSQELQEKSTCAKIAQVHNEGSRKVLRETYYYNLDMIISVGYRVNSIAATKFRQWANNLLKEYLIKGYAINQRLSTLEDRVSLHDRLLSEHKDKLDFFIRSEQPPLEGIFYDSQIFDAYHFVSDLVRMAKHRIVLFDNYVDDSVLALLDKRTEGVEAVIYTKTFTSVLRSDLQKHNAQYPSVKICEFSRSHDRFLCIDETVYHFGASLKDMGKKWFAFSKMEIGTAELLQRI